MRINRTWWVMALVVGSCSYDVSRLRGVVDGGSSDGNGNTLSGDAAGAGGVAQIGGGGQTGGGGPMGGAFTTFDSGVGGSQAQGDAASQCTPTIVAVQRQPPHLLAVLDRSGSMARTIGNMIAPTEAESRWSISRTVIDSILSETSSRIVWGMKMFPTCRHRTGSGPFDCDRPEGTNNACAVDGLAFAPGIAQVAELSGLIFENPPFLDAGATPTAPGIAAAVTLLKSDASDAFRALVLLTDGAPNCGVYQGSTDPAISIRCSPKGVGTRCDVVGDGQGGIDAVAAATSEGFPVFVVGFALPDPTSSVDPKVLNTHVTLNAMADRGGRATGDSTFHYFRASDVSTLSKALLAITSAAECEVPLTVPLTPGRVYSVRLGGSEIVNEDAVSGWTRGAGGKSIVFHGLSCERTKKGTFDRFELVSPCDR